MKTYRQPFKGSYPITQQYGEIIPGVTKNGKPHTGIDYACPKGTPILASADGTVVKAGWDLTGYGNMVAVRHPDMQASFYAHLSEICVKAGQAVKQGDVIGKSGFSGNVVPAGAAGAHLHFEMRSITGKPFDPATVLMSVYDKPGTGPEGACTHNHEKPGIYQVKCEAAFVRDWETLSRVKMVYKGERVYLFEDRKEMDGLTFYYIGAGYAMAVVDAEGTQILDNSEA